MFISPIEPQQLEIIDYLDAIPQHQENSRASAQREFLYSALSIIDAKSQGLLSFNSFLLAIVGIFFGVFADIRGEWWVLLPLLLAGAGSGISCLFCLDVIWVYWLSADEMRAPAHAQKNDGITTGMVELVALRDQRTRTYRSAWLLSFLSLVFLLIGIASATATELL